MVAMRILFTEDDVIEAMLLGQDMTETCTRGDRGSASTSMPWSSFDEGNAGRYHVFSFVEAKTKVKGNS